MAQTPSSPRVISNGPLPSPLSAPPGCTKVLYTARTHTTGGRDGASRASDGRLDVKLSSPDTPGNGTNPEQLLAAGWSACFLSAIGVAANKMKVRLPPDSAIDAEVNLGIAASTPRGLVVPNIKDAHRLPLHQLAVELQTLTNEARSGKVTPRAMADGTITITNVGALGIDTGTPILNPGEAAILAFGAIRQQPWVHEGAIQIRHVTQLALSFDHRLVDGELGARVLADVGRVMNDPGQGLVWG